jgi:hypothetical protein
MPIPAILNQLYTTPGRYSLHELTFSGHPLGLMGARVIAPVIAANVGLTSIALRGCNLSDGSALHELLWVMEKHAQLESLDLSCNRLSDENGHAEALLEFISIHPMLLHIGLGKNELSGESIHKIRVALAARSDSPPPTVSVPGEALAHRSLPLLPATEGSHGGVGHRKEVGGGGALLHLPSGGASPHSNRNGSSPPKPTRPDQQPAKSPAPRPSPRYADTQARVDSCRHGGNRRRRANSPQAPQTLTLVGVDSIEVSVPVISQSKFFAAVNIFVSLMARQLGMLEMSVFATMLPHAFEVYRKQCGSTNAEYVTLLQYLEATFPFCGRKRMLHTLKAFSQYSLIAPVRRPTKETLRVDQRDEIDLIFKTLDKEGQGVLPTSVLNHPNANSEETL